MAAFAEKQEPRVAASYFNLMTVERRGNLVAHSFPRIIRQLVSGTTEDILYCKKKTKSFPWGR